MFDMRGFFAVLRFTHVLGCPTKVQLRTLITVLLASLCVGTAFAQFGGGGPAAPVLTATPGDAKAYLSWTATGVGYKVFRAISSSTTAPANSAFSSITAWISPTTYTNMSLTNGTVYYWYAVQAQDDSGATSAFSNKVKITPMATPTGVTASAGTWSITVSWTGGGAGVSTYRVQRATSSNGTYTTVASGLTGTSYSDSPANNTTYYYVVRGDNDTGTGDASSPVVSATLFRPPTNESAVAGTARVSLSWTAATGATSYTIWRGPNGGPYNTSVATVTGTSYTDTGLTNGTTYYYAFQANYSGGSSPKLSQWLATPIAVPGSLTATAGNGSITLNWTSAAGASSYKVFRGTASGSHPTLVVSGVTGTTYTDTGVTVGTPYYYVVDGVNSTGISDDSNEASATAGSAPASPNVSVGDGDHQLSLSWPAVSGATSYSITWSTDNTNFSPLATNITQTFYTQTGLTNGNTYYYHVTASNSFGTSAPTSVSGIPNPPLTAPQNLAGTPGNASVSLTWDAVPTATGYQIWVDHAPMAPQPFTSTTNSYTVSGLTNGLAYQIWVQATRGQDTSYSSNTITVTPLAIPSTPTGPTATPGDQQLTLSWNAVSGATSYSITWSTDNVNFTPLVTNITQTSYTHSGLTNGNTYYYKVVATNSSGSSAPATVSGVPNIPLTAPANLTVGPVYGTLTLSWDPVPGATGYHIYWGNIEPFNNNDVTTNYFTFDPGANAVAPISLNVWATRGSERGPTSSCTYDQNHVPQSPTGLTATHSGQTGIHFSWSPVTGASWYAASQQNVVDTGAWTELGTPTGTSVDTSAPSDTQAYLRVRTHVGAMHSDWTEMNFSTLPDTPVLGSASGGNGEVTLTWNPQVPSATQLPITFEVGVSSTQGSGYVFHTATSSGVYVDSEPNGSLHYYVLRAYNTANDYTPISNELSARAGTPNAPTLSANPIVNGIHLSWNEPAGTDSYVIKWGTASNGLTNTIPISDPTTTAYDFSQPGQNGTKFFFVIDALNNVGTSPDSNLVSAVQGGLEDPTGVQLSQNGDSQNNTANIKISWTGVTGATSYPVEKFENGAWVSAGSAPTGSPFSFDALGDADVQVRIRATDGTLFSNWVTLTIRTLPDKPTISTVTSDPSHVYVTWTPQVPGTGQLPITYQVGHSTIDGGGANGYTFTAGTSPYTDNNPALQAMNYYVVRAYNADTPPPYTSNSAQVSIWGGAPGAPNLTDAHFVSGGVSLTWQAAGGADTYHVFQSSSPNASTTGHEVTPTGGLNNNVLTFTDNTAKQGGTYYYEVVAHNSAGDSLPSNERSPSNGPAKPTNFQAVAVYDSHTIIATWAESDTGCTFRLEEFDGQNWNPILPTAGNTLRYAFTTLQSYTTHTYRVIATLSGVDSLPSDPATETTLPGAPVLKIDDWTAIDPNSNSGQVTFSWTQIGSLQNYVFKKRPNVPDWDENDPVQGLTRTETDLKGQNYICSVCAVDDKGREGDVSNWIVFCMPSGNEAAIPLGASTVVVGRSGLDNESYLPIYEWDIIQDGNKIADNSTNIGVNDTTHGWDVQPIEGTGWDNATVKTPAASPNTYAPLGYGFSRYWMGGSLNIYPFRLYGNAPVGSGATFIFGDPHKPTNGTADGTFQVLDAADGTDVTQGWQVAFVQGNQLQVIPPLDADKSLLYEVRYLHGTDGISGYVKAGPMSGWFVKPINETTNSHGYLTQPLALPDWYEDTIPSDQSDAPGAGPAGAFNVLLPYGVLETNTGPDMVVENPYGDDVSFERTYRTPLSAAGLSSPGLPYGWVNNWDIKLVTLGPGWSNLDLVYPSGAHEIIHPRTSGGNATGQFQVATGAPYQVTGTPDPDNPGKWLDITFTSGGSSKQIFTPVPLGLNYWYRPTKIYGSNGNHVEVSYDPTTTAVTQVTAVNDQTQETTPLLTMSYIITGQAQTVISNVTDEVTQRTVNFSLNNAGQFLSVSKVNSSVADYSFDYQQFPDRALINKVTTAGGDGADADAFVSYSADGRIWKMKDADGNIRAYKYDDDHHNVTVYVLTQDISDISQATSIPNIILDTWTEAENSAGQGVASTSMSNDTTATQYSSTNPALAAMITPPGPASPETITIDSQDPNHRNPAVITYPFGDSVHLTWHYSSAFPMGIVQSVAHYPKVGQPKPATTYSFADTTNIALKQFAGYINSITYAAPNSTPTAPATEHTDYHYTSMGNIDFIDAPGPGIGNSRRSITHWAYGTPEVLGRPVSMTDPSGRVTTYTYDANGNVNSVSFGGRTTNYDYDLNTNQLLTITYPPSNPATGLRSYVELVYATPGKPATQAIYHGEGGNTQTINSTNSKEWATLGVDGATVQTSQTLQPNFNLSSVSSYYYDPINGTSTAVKHSFQEFPSQRKANTSISGDTWTATSAAPGNLLTVKDPANRTTTITPAYGDQRPSMIGNNTTGDFSQINYESNGFGRVTSTMHQTSTGTGDIVSQTTEAYTYDDQDNVLTKKTSFDSGVSATVTYTYYDNGERATMSLGGYTYSYQYNDDGTLSKIIPSNGSGPVPGGEVDYTYDPVDGRLTSVQSGVVWTYYIYDGLGRVIDIKNMSPMSPQQSTDPNRIIGWPGTEGGQRLKLSWFQNVRYDDFGNRTYFDYSFAPLLDQHASTGMSGNAFYQYSDNRRLTEETYTPLTQNWRLIDIGHAYDNADNVNTADFGTYSFNAKDQIDVQNGYDADGNQLTDAAGKQLTYDIDDNLVTRDFDYVNPQTGQTQSSTMWYGYNASGQRTYKYNIDSAFGYQSRYFIWDGDQLLAELNDSGQVSAINTWGPDGLNIRLWKLDSFPDVLGYAYDPNGSRCQRSSYLESHAGQTEVSFTNELYDAYGRLLQYSTGNAYSTPDDTDVALDPYGYKGNAGYYSDREGQSISSWGGDVIDNFKPGLIYCEHRYYSPQECRWITRDPMGLEGGINVYEYCGDDPLDNLDPDGLRHRRRHHGRRRRLYHFWVTTDGNRFPTYAAAYNYQTYYLNPKIQAAAAAASAQQGIGQPPGLVGMVPFVGPGWSFIGHIQSGDFAAAGLDAALFAGDFDGEGEVGQMLEKGAEDAAEKLADERLAGLAYKEVKKYSGFFDAEAHHINEKRLAEALGIKERDMASILLTREEHQNFTNLWREALPYGKSYTRAEVRRAAKKVYRRYPELLRIALGEGR